MTAEDFRRIALSFAGTSEKAHMSHPDFRIGGKVFASLGYPDKDHAMVVLAPDEQKRLVHSYAKAFAPAKGAWGKRGNTIVVLGAVDKTTLRDALDKAWRRIRDGRSGPRKNA